MPKIIFNASDSSTTQELKRVYSSAVRQQDSSLSPVISTNPYGNTEYEYFEEIWSGGVGGEALDTVIDFAFGKGVKISAELIDKGELTEEQQAEKLKSYQKIIDQIKKHDELPNVRANERFKAAARLAKVFGRALIAFEPDGRRVSGVDVLKIIHPRDLGRVYIKDYDWSVSSVTVNLFQRKKDNIKAEEMIYLVNEKDNPIRRNIGYGFSEFHRIVGAARSMRRFIEYDSPEIVQSMWASYGMFILRPQSKSPSTDANNLLGGLRAGGFNAVVANPEDVVYNNVKLDAEVEKMTALMNFFERIMIGNFKVPAPLLGREEEANMATLFGKIRLFKAGPVEDFRNWIAPELEQQWYNRQLEEISPEAAKIIKIKVDFEPLIIESWADVVDSLATLRQRVLPEMPLEMILKLANLENFKPIIEKELKEREKEMKENPEQQEQGKENGEDTQDTQNPQDTQNIQRIQKKGFQAAAKKHTKIQKLTSLVDRLERLP